MADPSNPAAMLPNATIVGFVKGCAVGNCTFMVQSQDAGASQETFEVDGTQVFKHGFSCDTEFLPPPAKCEPTVEEVP